MTLQEQLRPSEKRIVRELVKEAGVDVGPWAFDAHGNRLENPNANTYRNSQWSFGGGEEPTVLSVWMNSINWNVDPPVHIGNQKAYQDKLNDLAKLATTASEKQQVRTWVNRAYAFYSAVQRTYSKQTAARVILIDGDRPDAGAAEAAAPKARSLDAASWYVHSYDPYIGEYRMVRGLAPPPRTHPDPFEGLTDPGEDPEFQRAINDLSQTEREALIRLRVGQGPFREALIRRWKGCSVTNCRSTELLVAGHIKPWSQCSTPAERLGDANGLLLTPNLDKLFDRGWITFDDRFRIIHSPQLKEGIAAMLGVDRNMRLRSEAGADMQPFLAWHRENLFRGTA